ncbi:uncharacterized protein LOC123529575 [Mercenaria mercenaria]|uniref:uncharacterized protein LOC123529575 n=1 Tax=Mercenaria mercenaria TaxID=6596 RepID=UPI00234E9119|nr:uncharacterized protein LOC123529575 [Mercenaria mercenaria]
MSDLQNTLKEVDIQVVYRRLEARRRNITRDGQMSKRQLASAYRGYHGLESQYHALQQMSNASMINTKVKNDHLQLKHVEEMKHMIEQEKSTKGKTEKDLKVMREDFTAQLAYQYVYKKQSFKRHYKSQKQKKPRPVSDKPELYELERRNSAKLNAPRPLGSLRQIESYKDELKFKFPPIAHHDNSNEIKSPRVNIFGEKSYTELKFESKDDKPQDMTSFPSIEDAMGIHVKFKYKPNDEDRLSTLTAPPAGLDAESDNESSDINPNLTVFDMGQNLILMRQKEKEKFEKHRVLPTTPRTKSGTTKEVQKVSLRRALPETPNRPSTVYLRSRNEVEMRKMVKKEATDVISSWKSLSLRKEKVELAKEHNKVSLTENPVPVFDRSRPTSAILRDFKEFKKHKEEEKVKREEEENQTIIVRQMSPQPRAGSPVATIRNKYMHSVRPGTARKESPTHAGQLHRTDSEKFPSVSRTSSFKEVPGTELFTENALLTAAERIELEREKRSKGSISADTNKMDNSQKTKRRLPVPPSAATKKIDPPKTIELKMCKRGPAEPAKMFNTSVLPPDRETDTINRVKLANVTHEEEMKAPLHDKRPPLLTINNEENSYTPTGKHHNNNVITGGPSPFPADSLTRIKSASSLYGGRDLWPKLSKKMHFDYENYSRTTPEMKKRLEVRARNRKKIQEKNAQLAVGMKKKALKKQTGKEAGTTDDSERPPTRVSFNENVIVFQTI